MFRHGAWLVLLAMLLCPLPAGAQVLLAWKFQEGETFFLENVEKTRHTLDFMGKTVKQESSITTVSSYTVKGKTDRETVLLIKIEKIKTKNSLSQESKDPDAQLAEKMEGAVFTVVLDQAHKVVRLVGFEDFIKKIAAGNEEIEKLARARMSQENLKNSIEDTYGFLPPRAISPGDTWKQDSLAPLGAFGSFKIAKTFTYDGRKDGKEIISLTSKMTYVPPRGEGALVKVAKGNLKAEDSRGNFIFDPKRGRLIRAQNQVLIRGSLTIEIMEQQHNMDLSLDLTSSIRIFTKKPSGK